MSEKYIVGDRVCKNRAEAEFEAKVTLVRQALGHSDDCRVVGVRTIIKKIDDLTAACAADLDHLIKPVSQEAA